MFITHDMSVVKHISDEICVMYLGQVVEKCEAKELFRNPMHPYAKALLSAIPIPNIHIEKKKIEMKTTQVQNSMWKIKISLDSNFSFAETQFPNK